MPNTATIKKNAPVPATKRAARPHKGLNETQEELVEIFTDMLLNGGAKTDVDLLLEALDVHRYRTRISQIYRGRNEHEVEKKIHEYLSGAYSNEYWYRALARTWPNEKAADKVVDEVAGSEAVIDVVRANIRNDLREKFEEFMVRLGNIEGAWFLNEVFSYCNDGDNDLVKAFTEVLSQDHTYIRVPWSLAKKTRDLLALLQKEAA